MTGDSRIQPRAEPVRRCKHDVTLNGLDDSHSTNLISDLANMVRALSPQAQAGETEYIVSQHIGWLKQYVQGMTADNWRDMQLRAARQLDELSGCVGVAQGSVARGDVTLNEDQAYHLFLIADTAARNERGKNKAVNHLRELLLPAYRAWHDANPGTAHPALSIPSTDGKGAA